MLYGNLNLTNERAMKDWFYLQMVSHWSISNIIQNTKTKTKDKDNTTLDKTNNKIDSINKINKRLS